MTKWKKNISCDVFRSLGLYTCARTRDAWNFKFRISFYMFFVYNIANAQNTYKDILFMNLQLTASLVRMSSHINVSKSCPKERNALCKNLFYFGIHFFFKIVMIYTHLYIDITYISKWGKCILMLFEGHFAEFFFKLKHYEKVGADLSILAQENK